MLEAFGDWHADVDALASSYATAQPFPHIVLDGFIAEDLARSLLEEFPDISEMPRSRDYVFGNKHELSSVEQRGAAGRRYRDEVLSADFAALVSAICGQQVVVDPGFHGGGFHQGGDGSYLDFHVDFNIHPQRPDWLRTLNVLLYLNPDWRPEYGGALQIKNRVDGPVTEIAPLFNRGVIMETSDRTYHGYTRTTLPPGTTRKSIAAYAYQVVAPGAVRAHTTGWHPEDASPLKRALAARYDLLVRAKNKVFGSATARNR